MVIETKQRKTFRDLTPNVDVTRYTFIDYATQTYLVLVGLIILFLHGDHLDRWYYLFGANVARIAGVHLLIRLYASHPDNRPLTFLRFLYPLMLITTLYRETGLVNQFITGAFHDPAFIALEEWMFGYQPVVRFMETFSARFVAEVLYFAYFSYYLLVSLVGLSLYFTNRRQVFHYVSVVTFVFYVCFFTFIVFPVLGPTAILLNGYETQLGLTYPVPAVPTSVATAWFYKLMTVIHGKYQVIGAAFPSSHVAVSVTAAYFAWLYLRRIRFLIAIDVFLLALATVYCRYHYAVDAIGGVLAAAILIPLGEWLYRRFR